MTLLNCLRDTSTVLTLSCVLLFRTSDALAQSDVEGTTKFEKLTLIQYADLRRKYGWDGKMNTSTCGGPGIMQVQKDGTNVLFGNWCFGNLRFKGAVGIIDGRGLNFDKGTTLTFPKRSLKK